MYKNCFVKYLCFRSAMTYDKTLCNHFQLITMVKRRKNADMVMFYNILHNSQLFSIFLLCRVHLNLPSRRTRHAHVFSPGKKYRLHMLRNDYISRCVYLANSLDALGFFDSHLRHQHIKGIFSDLL